MAQLTVRGVPDDLAAALKTRAAQAGRSAEAEHRRILEEALRPARATEFFEAVRSRRIKLGSGDADTADLLRADRDRNGA
ncbi:FitA-like ribbon-helix-helix domain-containing protein [Rubellimicrobium aerolatum]|uniref:Antitoxin FitA-like ribbon-helix-helix domain-containing protein n=1 Tax=Rubellimicrobium aerolatum TaxID=490979 RepID=A0ABW0SF45_9RHOB|nr:hypothetical protein [Rubellimicrobium aerolatum]MBP1806922.1 plasmid stability protein [Rubellimicrobium aerolatum]